MGHRNTQFTGHVIDLEANPHSHNRLHQEPCVFYGSAANYPQSNGHSLVPALGNRCNFNIRHMPEHHEHTFFYGMPQYTGFQPQHPPVNLDLAVTAPSSHYNPYLAPPSGILDFPVQVNHTAHDTLSLSSSQRVIGVPTDSYGRNVLYGDGVRGSYKRNIVEGTSLSYQQHSASAGPSSSSTSVTGRLPESDIASVDDSSFIPPEYGGNDATARVETGSHPNVRNRSGLVGPESVMMHNSGHLLQGSYTGSPVQMPGNPWLDMHFGASNGGIGSFPWTQAPDLSFVRASISGASVETGNVGTQGYQLPAGSRSSNGFILPIPQGHPTPHHPAPQMQGVRGYNVNFPSHAMAASSRRISTPGASNNAVNPFLDIVDAVPAFGLQTGFRMYQPYRRGIVLDSNARPHSLPQLRVLPEDEVAMLEIPGYHGTGDHIDHHVDMRLDIDHMSYEELLALGEQIGSVGTELTAEFIGNLLKTRTYIASMASFNLEEAAPLDEQINFCVICQTDYEDGETIGSLDCGHEYHRACIKKWLVLKNTCPMCKAMALSSKGKS